MVSTTITFEKDNVQPPVYVAGTFTDWAPMEMSFETTESNGSTQHVFSYKADLDPGDYQYKFRLGPANDEHGNVNNVVSVKAQVSKPRPEEPIEKISKPVAPILNTKDAHIIEDEPDRPSENGISSQQKDIEPYPPAGVVMSNLLDSQDSKEVDVRAEDPNSIDAKQVHLNGAADKMAQDGIAARKDSIPDFAPPPYSIATNGTVAPPAASTNSAVPSEKQPAGPVVNSKPETKAKSFISQICNTRTLVLVVAMVAVPAAVSYYLRR
ncbi:uncharacterized protein Z520_03160 [Fonsecaea multimorphosa CBS 102226]|uniref:AMP-activated protein kinase glycogen-binding domain-containing protein n=1 Tax=Fonsecaea multimorphosa CBS 102226 TaxID=1442371 RepID=A0A0D2K6T6_9EURO|nr:uncharacterized protein Z520_03160 [Fonsecaea multimorphosa CBS 102226]KIY01608.1 hypothetical protein Z520_03160 [Fonsecaea multimorphosa CBS 102226]